MSNKKFIAIVSTLVILIGVLFYGAWDRFFRYKKYEVMNIETVGMSLTLDRLKVSRQFQAFCDHYGKARKSETDDLGLELYYIQLKIEALADDVEELKELLPKKYQQFCINYVDDLETFQKYLIDRQWDLLDDSFINNFGWSNSNEFKMLNAVSDKTKEFHDEYWRWD